MKFHCLRKPFVFLSASVLACVLSHAACAQTPAAAAPSAAATAPTTLKPEVIDLAAMKYEDLGPMQQGHGTVRSKTLVVTPSGTVSVQSGDAPKHKHALSDEVQYIISGSGTFWVGDTPRHVHPGDLIVIPKNTAHAGSHANSGRFKSISIKFPPPVAGDMQLVP